MKNLLSAIAIAFATPALSMTCEIDSVHAVPGFMNQDVLDNINVYVDITNLVEGIMVGTSYPYMEYKDTWDSIMENLDGTFSMVEEFEDEDGAVLHRVTITTVGQLPTGLIYVFIADCGGGFH